MPSYLTDELGFNLSSAGALSTIPYVLLFITTLGSSRVFTWLEKQYSNPNSDHSCLESDFETESDSNPNPIVAGSASFSWSVSRTRQTAQQIGLLGAGIGLVVCGFVSGVSVPAAFLCMILAQVLYII